MGPARKTRATTKDSVDEIHVDETATEIVEHPDDDGVPLQRSPLRQVAGNVEQKIELVDTSSSPPAKKKNKKKRRKPKAGTNGDKQTPNIQLVLADNAQSQSNQSQPLTSNNTKSRRGRKTPNKPASTDVPHLSNPVQDTPTKDEVSQIVLPDDDNALSSSSTTDAVRESLTGDSISGK